ncbi:polyprenyl synthetase family protein [Thermodesulfobacteriota bacterium]
MSTDGQFLDRFNKHFEKIDRELEGSIDSNVPLIKEIVGHSLLSQGKRLRPLLFVLSALMNGYDKKDIYHMSIIFEYIHCASLLHDDVIDKAETRRKKPSASNVWGNSAAVLTGDYMFSIASSIAIGSKSYNILEIINDAAARMTEGQVKELVFTGNWDAGEEEYLDIITSKTADLISASCASGAVIAKAGDWACEKLKNFGLNMGISFQMVDDLLDYSSSEKDFGKPVGKDVREGKITLPLIYAISSMNKGETDRFKETFIKGSSDDIDYEELINFVRESGSVEKTRAKAEKYVEKAAEYLKEFPETSYRDDLIALNNYMTGRLY